VGGAWVGGWITRTHTPISQFVYFHKKKSPQKITTLKRASLARCVFPYYAKKIETNQIFQSSTIVDRKKFKLEKFTIGFFPS